jgi:hypothetical protein
MGQKSNILTVRNVKSNLNLKKNNSKLFLYGFKFLELLNTVTFSKDILLTEKTLNFVNNQCFYNLELFYRTKKLVTYKNKKKTHLKNDNSLKTTFAKQNSVLTLFLNQFKTLHSSLFVFNFKVLNNFIDKNIVLQLFRTFRSFFYVLFNRRFNLFVDFLKLTFLLYVSKIPVSAYLFLLGQIFKVLPKKTHNRFLVFLELVFKFLLTKKLSSKRNIFFSTIKGIKFIVNGKIRGKMRSSSKCISVGTIPIQSLNKNIEFSKTHVYTLYGAFGFQIWLYRDK